MLTGASAPPLPHIFCALSEYPGIRFWLLSLARTSRCLYYSLLSLPIDSFFLLARSETNLFIADCALCEYPVPVVLVLLVVYPSSTFFLLARSCLLLTARCANIWFWLFTLARTYMWLYYSLLSLQVLFFSRAAVEMTIRVSRRTRC
jgi:hypothetical protein